MASALILPLGKPLLSIFNNDPQVVDVGYIRLATLMIAHLFSLCYEVLTMAGVYGIRLSWIYFVFPKNPTFQIIMAQALFVYLLADT